MASGWIENRGGRHCAVVRLNDGKRRSKTFERKADAKRWLAQVQADLDRGDFIDPRLGRVTYADWLAVFRRSEVGLRATSLARDDMVYRRYLTPDFGDLTLDRITPVVVQSWVAGLAESGLAASTIHKYYQTLSKTLTSAVDMGLLQQSPCSRNIRLPEIVREEMRFLSPQEVARLASSVPLRYRAMIVTAAYGGLRLGELAGLRRKRIDLLRGVIDVAEIAVEVRGKLQTGPPKTRAGSRRVPIPGEVAEMLALHLADYCEDDPDGYVFTGPQGGPLRPPAWRARIFVPAVTAANLAPLRPHDLRHTAAAIWIAAGIHPKEIAVRLGHTSVVQVMDRYGHLLPTSDEEFRSRVGALFVAPGTSPALVVNLDSRRHR